MKILVVTLSKKKKERKKMRVVNVEMLDFLWGLV